MGRQVDSVTTRCLLFGMRRACEEGVLVAKDNIEDAEVKTIRSMQILPRIAARASSRLLCVSTSRARLTGRAQFPRVAVLLARNFDSGSEGLPGVRGIRCVLDQQQLALRAMYLGLAKPLPAPLDEWK
jgi:hypothetical protein